MKDRMDILAKAREANERATTSTGGKLWARLLEASPHELAALVGPLSDGEAFVAAVVVGCLRPGLHTAAARAFLARREVGRERSFEASSFVDVAVARRWLEAGGDALTVVELLALFGGIESSHLLEPAVEQRLASKRLADARAITRSVDRRRLRQKSRFRALIGRYVAIQEGLEAAASDLYEAVSATTRLPPMPHESEELEALAGVISVLVTFVPPGHAAVTRSLRLVDSLEGSKVEGIRRARSRIAQTLADAASPGAAAGWLEHAVRAASAGVDGEAEAHLEAARARLGVSAGSGVIPALAAPAPTHDSLAELGRHEPFAYRAWRALRRGSDALAAGDREDALASFALAFSPPVPPLAGEERAMWVAALLDTAPPGVAAAALVDALAAESHDVGPSLLALLERVRAAVLAEAWGPLVGRGLIFRLQAERRDRCVLDAIVSRLVALDDRALAGRIVADLAPVVMSRGPGGRPGRDPLTARDEACTRLSRLFDGLPTEPDRRRLVALAIARGETGSPPGPSEGLPSDEIAVLEQLTAPQARVVKRRDGAGRPSVSVTARFKPGSDDRSDTREMWLHRIARAQLDLGRLDDAIATLEQMRDCRAPGFGPAVLAGEITQQLDRRPDGWTAERASKLLDVLSTPAVIAQEFTSALVFVMPRAWPRLTVPMSLETFRVKMNSSEADQAMVDLALALALWRGGDTARAEATLTQALGQAERGTFLYGRPGWFLDALREMPGLPGWSSLWERAFGLFASSVEPTMAVQGIRSRALRYTPVERRLLLGQLARPWPDAVRDALFDACCLALAAGETDDQGLASLLAAAERAEQARRATVAAAASEQRAGRTETARELARLAGLEA